MPITKTTPKDEVREILEDIIERADIRIVEDTVFFDMNGDLSGSLKIEILPATLVDYETFEKILDIPKFNVGKEIVKISKTSANLPQILAGGIDFDDALISFTGNLFDILPSDNLQGTIIEFFPDKVEMLEEED